VGEHERGYTMSTFDHRPAPAARRIGYAPAVAQHTEGGVAAGTEIKFAFPLERSYIFWQRMTQPLPASRDALDATELLRTAP